MRTKGKTSSLWRGLTAISASLLAIIVGATAIVNANASFINGQLGITNYKIVDTADGEKKDTTYFKSEYASIKDLIAAKNQLAEEISEEGTVLFKNIGNTLPLDIANEKVTLWGLNSINPTLGGMIGSSVAIDAEGGQKQYDLVTALTEKGFSLNADMLALYQSDAVNGKGGYGRNGGHSLTPSFGKMYENAAKYKIGEAPSSIYTDAVLASADGTVALVTLSRDNSEAADYNTKMISSDANDSFERPLALSANEKAMIALAKAHSSKVVVLLNSDNPIEIEDLKNDDAIGAIVWTGAPGANGFLGVADVLSGAVNPSGHIADTYAVNSTSAPSMVNFGVYMYTNNSQDGSGDKLGEDDKGDWYLVESEGIYNGYKYYETRYEDSVLGQGNADAEEGATNGGAWNWASKDFSKTFSLQAMYKYYFKGMGRGGFNGYQLTAVWGNTFAGGLCTFSGFIDVWYDKDVRGKLITISEPQFWFNLNKLKGMDGVNLSLGTEVEISNNFVFDKEGRNDKFYAIPTIAAKWTF